MIKTKVFYAVQCDRCGEIDNDHWMPDIESLEYDEWDVNGKKHYCPDCIGKKPIPNQVYEIKRFLEAISCRDEASIVDTQVGLYVECFLPVDYLTEAQIGYIKELASPYSINVHIVPPHKILVVEVKP